MKTSIFSCLLVLTGISTFAQQMNIPLEGTWQVVGVNTPEFSGIKMWSNYHYTFINRSIVDNKFIYGYGGGTYTLDGNRYEETIVYNSWLTTRDSIGMKWKMILEIRNDTLFQTYPVNENWQIAKNHIVEKYVRSDYANKKVHYLIQKK